ncbi:MAG TPA: response regulator, partial [Chthonomonadaceae bacterium]|nr:response regulator [Chthonomonadaceae bacterium]
MIARTTDPAQGLRVLIVEDEALIADEIEDRLTRLHYQVVGTADTGVKAIEIAERERPGLALMDIHLKGPMDGIQAADHLYRNLGIPSVFLTAQADQATFQRAAHIAPFGYVFKPFHEKDLVIAIEIALHRYRMEQGLRNSELTYATMVNSIADGVIATDAEGRVCFLNSMAEKLTGRRIVDVQGLSVEEALRVLGEASSTEDESPIVSALQQRCTIELSEAYSWIDRHGEPIPIEGSAAPVLDTTGRVIGAMVVFREITARKQAEEALAKAVEALETNNWELAEARDAALAAARVKSEFLANTSHEIRT